MSENEKVDQAMEKYYSLKNKYDEKVKEKKKLIIKNKSLGYKEKKKLLDNLEVGCINCKNKGKTIFINNEKMLSAKCGALKKDNTHGCKLNIEIKKGDYDQMKNLVSFLNEEANEIKANIIKTKLDLLFGYINETEATSKYTEQKEDYDLNEEELNKYYNIYKKILNNSENQGKIKEKVEEKKNLIINIKDLVEESLMTEAIEVYINDVDPLAKEIQNLKYKTNQILCSNGEKPIKGCADKMYYLIQEPFNYRSTEVEFTIPELIKLDK